jgi:signal transduction histidine kinase
MSKIWELYRKSVERNCTDPDQNLYEVAYWRNDLFSKTVLFLIPLSAIAIIPGIYLAFIEELKLLLFADLLIVLCLLMIAFYSGLALQTRKVILCTGLYFVTVVLLYYLGSFGPGLLYLLAITLFTTLIFEFKFGLASLLINIMICVSFGVLIHYDLGGSQVVLDYELDSWIGVASSLIFLCAVFILLVPRLFDGLQSAFEKRKQAEQDLKNKQAELKQSLRQLEQKNRELETFAYTASHDLKEPLRMVSSFMELLKKKYGGELDEQALKYIHFAMDGAGRMNKLMDDLLEYSRVGRVHNVVSDTDLNQILNGLLKDYIQEIEDNKISVIYEKLPVIKAVSVSMELLFKNLISNSLKYQSGKQKPIITIRHKESATHWHFEVEDNGIGIDPSFHHDIFQLFKRLHSSTEYPGSGLGLAICKKITEQHGGEIRVESEPDKGSTFFFTIEKL